MYILLQTFLKRLFIKTRTCLAFLVNIRPKYGPTFLQGKYMEMIKQLRIKAFNFKISTKYENVSPFSYQETQKQFLMYQHRNRAGEHVSDIPLHVPDYESANSVKDQIVNMLGFAGLVVSVTATHLCRCSLKAAITKCKQMDLAVF